MTTAVAQRFAQIFGAVYLLVGIEVSSRLHRYSRKPHSVRFSSGDSSTQDSCSACSPSTGFTTHNPRRGRGRGLDVYCNPTATSAYALVLGVAYLELFILGLFTG